MMEAVDKLQMGRGMPGDPPRREWTRIASNKIYDYAGLYVVGSAEWSRRGHRAEHPRRGTT